MRYNKKRTCIGTSGWIYPHWKQVFYPAGLSQGKWLDFYARQFETAELNYSFYRLPAKEAFRAWSQKTPKDFIFAVKASRYISHIKRLKDDGSYKNFLFRAKALKEKLGPVLFQFPGNFKRKDETLERMDNFLKILDPKIRHAFEFRDISWDDEQVFEILKKKNCAWVIPDRGGHKNIVTADFVYYRMHGPTQILYQGNYPAGQLQSLAREIKDHQKNGRDVYVYFNNDVAGYAPKNANQLIQILNQW